ncbi:MAG: hypothetical protein OXR73_32815, partial [Myxococcales bacterium]|nr:hypothetical protein [Myxococcales bacterium]
APFGGDNQRGDGRVVPGNDYRFWRSEPAASDFIEAVRNTTTPSNWTQLSKRWPGSFMTTPVGADVGAWRMYRTRLGRPRCGWPGV